MKPIFHFAIGLCLALFAVTNAQSQCTAAIQQNGYACVDVGPYNITNSYTSWITNGPQYTYSWSVPGNAMIVNGQGTPTIEVRWLSPGGGNIDLNVSNPTTSCFDFASYPVTAGGGNNGPLVQGPDTVCVGDTIQYTNQWFYGPGLGVTYYGYYSYGANLISSVANQVPSANYTSYDTLYLSWDADAFPAYIAFEHVRFSTSCINYSEKPITILGAMDGPQVVCAGDIVTYQMLNGVNVNSWTVTGGTIISGQGTSTLSVQWPSALTGTVACNWSYPNYGTKNSSISIDVTIPTPPVIAGPDTLCTSFNGLFNYSVPNQPGHSYSWTVTNATFNNGINTGNFVQIRPDTNSTLLLEVTDVLGTCSVTSQKTIVNEYPLSAIIGSAAICAPDTESYKIERNFTGATYNWLISGGNIVSGQGTDSVTIAWVNPGSGILNVTVNWNGCTSVLRDTVEVFSSPQVDIGFDFEVCPGVPLNMTVFDNFLSSGATYLNSDGQASAIITIDTVGVYWLDKTLFYNSLACTARDSLIVSYYPNTNYPNLGPDTALCSTSSPYLLSAGPGYASYNWSTTGNTPSINVTTSGTYSVTVTSTQGNCSLADTVIVMLTNPPSVNLGPDQMICPDTFTTLDAGPGAISYLWSDNSTSQTLTASSAGLYWVEASSSANCSARDSISISILPDCVFPGDANHDGVANNTDLINLGVAFGSSDAVRPLATQTWYGQPAPNWAASFPSTINYKHADSDGNGVVNDDDTLAVTNNYGLTHNKTSGGGGGVPLRLIPQQNIFLWGDTLRFDVELGDFGSQAVDAYGLAFSTQINPSSILPGSFQVSYPASFLGTKGVDMITLWSGDVQPGLHDLALARTNQANVSGYGRIATLEMIPDSSLFAGQDTGYFQISLLAPYLVNVGLQDLNISSFDTTIAILNPTLSLNNSSNLFLEIQPNPADQSSRLSFLAPAGESLRLQVLDLRGKILREETANATGVRQYWEIPTQELSEGLYLIKVVSKENWGSQKLLIQR